MEGADGTSAVSSLSMRGPINVSKLSHPRLPRHKNKTNVVVDHNANGVLVDGRDDKNSNNNVTKLNTSLDGQELTTLDNNQPQETAQLNFQMRRNSFASVESGLGPVSELQGSSAGRTVTSEQSKQNVFKSLQSGNLMNSIEQQMAMLTARQQAIQNIKNRNRALSTNELSNKITSTLLDSSMKNVSSDVDRNRNETLPLVRIHDTTGVHNQVQVAAVKPCVTGAAKSALMDPDSSAAFRRNRLQESNDSVSSLHLTGLASKTEKNTLPCPLPSTGGTGVPVVHRQHSLRGLSRSFSMGSGAVSSSSSSRRMLHRDNDGEMEVASSVRPEMTRMRKALNKEDGERMMRYGGKQDWEMGNETLRNGKDLRGMKEIVASGSEGLGNRRNTTDGEMSQNAMQHLAKGSMQQHALTRSLSVPFNSECSTYKEKNGTKPSVCYGKLKLMDETTQQPFFLTVMAPCMNNIAECCLMISKQMGAEMVKFGAGPEDLVDEMSEQIGVPLAIVKQHSLPADRHYSVDDLMKLSTVPLSYHKPANWDNLIQQFEGEGIKGVLLRDMERNPSGL